MMRTLSIALMSIIALTAMSGCSTQVQVSALKPDLTANEIVNGLPFRARERYRITLYQLEGLTYEPVQTKLQTVNLANLDELYVLRVKGSALSDSTVTVKMRSDNTLEKVKVESKSKGQEALTALGKGFKDLSDAEAAREKVAEGDVVASEDKHLAALEAKQAADLAAIELADLPATTTRAQRTAVEQKVVKLKLIANHKARRAGLQLPFPDAS